MDLTDFSMDVTNPQNNWTSEHETQPEKVLKKPKKIFHCNDCEYSTSHSSNMFRHKMTVHLKKRYMCAMCDRGFVENFYLKQHIRTVHDNKTLICEKCQRIFFSYSSLRNHLIVDHGQNLKYQCQICKKKFAEKIPYESHMNVHNGFKPHKCSTCDKSFALKSSLKKHKKYCDDPDTTYTCGVCLKNLKDSLTLISHIKGVHGSSDKICLCGKAFSWKSALNRHQKVCPLLVANQEDNNHQIGEKDGLNESCPLKKKLFSCDKCEYTTVTNYNLLRHQRSVHEKRRYHCKTCGKDYGQMYNLRVHMATVHENMQFICEKCSKSFCSKPALERHMILNHDSGPALFQCTPCNEKFCDKKSYLGHIDTFHQDSKRCTCSVCNKEFPYKASLKKHLKICKGKKPVDTICKLCLKQFKSKETLRSHFRGKHNSSIKICLCGKTFSWATSFSRHKKICSRAEGSVDNNQQSHVDDSELQVNRFGDRHDNCVKMENHQDGLQIISLHRNLAHSHTIPSFDTLQEHIFGKHCEQYRNCL